MLISLITNSSAEVLFDLVFSPLLIDFTKFSISSSLLSVNSFKKEVKDSLFFGSACNLKFNSNFFDLVISETKISGSPFLLFITSILKSKLVISFTYLIISYITEA